MTFEIASGEKIWFRPVRPDDEPLVADAFNTASQETLLYRFFSPLRRLSSEQVRPLVVIDPVREVCVVGELAAESGKRIVCGARYVRLTDPSVAEIALTVHDDVQGRGIGGFMLRHLIQLGRADGIETFVADVLPTNTKMLRLLEKVAPQRRTRFAEGVCHIEFDLADAMVQTGDSSSN